MLLLQHVLFALCIQIRGLCTLKSEFWSIMDRIRGISIESLEKVEKGAPLVYHLISAAAFQNSAQDRL